MRWSTLRRHWLGVQDCGRCSRRMGTVTAGNAPGVNDAAAAVVVMSAAIGRRRWELKVMATIKRAGDASGVAPRWVMLAPVTGREEGA